MRGLKSQGQLPSLLLLGIPFRMTWKIDDSCLMFLFPFTRS